MRLIWFCSVVLCILVLYFIIFGFKKQNLIKPMFTGLKSAKYLNKKDGIAHSKLVIAFFIAIAVAIFVYWLVIVNAPVIEEFY